MDTLARTGITIPETDGSDSTTAFRLSTRSIGQFVEDSVLVGTEGLLASRPAAGDGQTLYKPTDVGLENVIYWDDGTAWRTIGAAPATDPAAGVGGLRTLGSGALQAAAGNHTHARDLYDIATPGSEAAGLLSVGTTVTVAAGITTIVAGPASGRRVVKALLICAPTAGTSVLLTLAGVTIRVPFSSANSGAEFALTLPIANGENLQATVTGGTVTFLASYVDITGATVDRFGFVNSAGSGTLVASSGSARVVNQIIVANPSTTTAGAATVTFAGIAVLSATPLAAGGLLTLDLPRPLPSGQTITYAGDGVTACTFLAVGH